MPSTIQLQVLPEVAAHDNLLKQFIAQHSEITEEEIQHIEFESRCLSQRRIIYS